VLRGKYFDVNTDFKPTCTTMKLIACNLSRNWRATTLIPHNKEQTAAAMRDWCVQAGEMAGTRHWRQCAPLFTARFEMHSRIKQRRNSSPEDCNLQMGVTWTRSNPTDHEEIFGVAAGATWTGNQQAAIPEGRARRVSKSADATHVSGALFATVTSLGYVPFQATAAMTQTTATSTAYRCSNARSAFCSSMSAASAKPIPYLGAPASQGSYLRVAPLCNVLRVNMDRPARATGVTTSTHAATNRAAARSWFWRLLL